MIEPKDAESYASIIGWIILCLLGWGLIEWFWGIKWIAVMNLVGAIIWQFCRVILLWKLNRHYKSCD